MRTAKDNAIGLYMDGIQNGRPREAVKNYTGDRYTQHSTGVPDGQQGFISSFEPFIERNPIREFKVVRSLQDGPLVFVQVYQNLSNGAAEWHTTDFFDSDEDGKIVEHWDVIAEVTPPNPYGRTQFDGPTEISDFPNTVKNRKLVVDFVNTCLIGRDLSSADNFISTATYHEHNPNKSDGLESFVDFYGAIDCPLSYQECFMTVAEGNFVATLNRARQGRQDLCQVDLFRTDEGKIVEHWDNFEPIPPKSEWANSGKF